MERTLVLIKPDAVIRGFVGEITSRLERKGLQLVGCKMLQLEENLLREHYSHLSEKPFFPRIKEFMESAPIVAQCWEGRDAVDVVRLVAGPTNGREARSGTIRGDLSMSLQCNLVHASDSIEAAATEIARFFQAEEIFRRPRVLDQYRYAADELGGE